MLLYAFIEETLFLPPAPCGVVKATFCIVTGTPNWETAICLEKRYIFANTFFNGSWPRCPGNESKADTFQRIHLFRLEKAARFAALELVVVSAYALRPFSKTGASRNV